MTFETHDRPWLALVVANRIKFGAKPLGKKDAPSFKLRVSPDDPEIALGDVVLVQDIAGREDGSVQLVKPVLAANNTPLCALYTIVARLGIEPEYPKAVHSEANALLNATGLDEPSLIDLTHRAYITIDNDDSRDLDQAMHIERKGNGFLVSYALSDAAYYVRPGTALFEEALRRGASYYLPELCIPMLPRVLSEGLVSLNEQVMRRALVFEMVLDAEGQCQKSSVVQAKIQSRAKLSYNGVQSYYDAPNSHQLSGKDFTETLNHLKTVGQLRRQLARKKHVVEFKRAEVTVSHSHGVFTAFSNKRLNVEKYNEQISLLCNVEGAKMLNGAGDKSNVQSIFRVHPAPPPEKLERLAALISDLIRVHNLDPKRWIWHYRSKKPTPLSDYLDQLPGYSPDASPLEVRLTAAIQRQAIVSNIRSMFEAEPGQHHGIGAPVYARFSSPMREIVGVFTHKEVLDLLENTGQSPNEIAADEQLRERIVRISNRAKATQKKLTKEANKLVIDHLFQRDEELSESERQRYEGTVMGVKSNCMYVQLAAPPIEVKVYLKHLNSQYQTRYKPNELGSALAGEGTVPIFRIGDLVHVHVHHYDTKKRQWCLQANVTN